MTKRGQQAHRRAAARRASSRSRPGPSSAGRRSRARRPRSRGRPRAARRRPCTGGSARSRGPPGPRLRRAPAAAGVRPQPGEVVERRRAGSRGCARARPRPSAISVRAAARVGDDRVHPPQRASAHRPPGAPGAAADRGRSSTRGRSGSSRASSPGSVSHWTWTSSAARAWRRSRSMPGTWPASFSGLALRDAALRPAARDRRARSTR